MADSKTKLQFGQTERQRTRESIWERSERQYAGDHWADTVLKDPSADKITVNMSFSTVQTIVPYATGSDPNFVVEPYSGDANIRNAKIQQAFLNRLWRSNDVAGRQELETATVDFLIYGDGYIKVGYDVVEQRLDDEGNTADVGKIWVDRVNPWDLWIDPLADGVHNARWVCQRLRITKDELQNSPQYTNTEEENVPFGEPEIEFSEQRESLVQEVFDGTEYASVYEFYDLVHNRLISFSDGNLPLRVVEDIGGVPIAQLGNYRIPNSPYHMGELEQLWALQQELNLTRSQMVTHRRRNVQKYIAKRGQVDDKAVEALTSAVVNDIAWVTGDGSLDDIIKPTQVAPLGADVYNMSQTISADIYEISGVNEYLRGASPEIRRTATEASIIEGASNVKSQFKLRQVERVAQDVGTIILATSKDVYQQTDYEEMQLFLTGREAEMVNRVNTGTEAQAMLDAGAPEEEVMAFAQEAMAGGNDAVIRPTPEIWVGTYQVVVEQSSTELRDPIMREQKYRQIFEMLVGTAPVLQQLGVGVNIKKIMEMWFDAAGIDDVDAMFQAPQAPPQPGGPPQDGGPPQEQPPQQGQAPGAPAPDNAQAPQEAVGPDNSGTFDPQNDPNGGE